MLYDPKWKSTTTATPSIDGLILWLEAQNPRGRYDFWSCSGGCLMDLYFIAIGAEYLEHREFWASLQSLAKKRPHTFGGALERLRTFKRTSR